MPRKRKQVTYKEDSSENEESEWEQEESEQPSSEEVEFDQDDDEASEESSEPRPKKTTTRKKPAPKKRKSFKMDDNEDDYLPSKARKTSHGGYAHTNKSRLKISKANKGKTPWNLGKNRSTSAKANIAAGVRARNRQKLLTKLEQWGMTEDEYNDKTKQIKYVRERLRRARKANRAAENQKDPEKRKRAKRKLNASRQAVPPGTRQAEAARATGEEEEEQGGDDDSSSNSSSGSSSEEEEDDEGNNNRSGPSAQRKPQMMSGSLIHPALSMFVRDFHWTPHPFDSSEVSYRNICPVGGPGGLICCSVCTATYSKYMSSTHQDIEEQSTSKVAGDLSQLLGFLETSKSQLEKTAGVAKKLKPPKNAKRAGVTEDGTVTILPSSSSK